LSLGQAETVAALKELQLHPADTIDKGMLRPARREVMRALEERVLDGFIK
jgi:hypothetical protein